MLFDPALPLPKQGLGAAHGTDPCESQGQSSGGTCGVRRGEEFFK